MSDQYIDAILVASRKRKRAQLQQELDYLNSGAMDHCFDYVQKSLQITRVMRTLSEYDAYVYQRECASSYRASLASAGLAACGFSECGPTF